MGASCETREFHIQSCRTDRNVNLSAECPPGTHGKNCAEVCDCEFASGCDAVTGQCVCEIGYRGDRCEKGKDSISTTLTTDYNDDLQQLAQTDISAKDVESSANARTERRAITKLGSATAQLGGEARDVTDVGWM